MIKKQLREVLKNVPNARFELEIDGYTTYPDFQDLQNSVWEYVSNYDEAHIETFQVEDNLYSFLLDQVVEVSENKIFAEGLDTDEQIVIHVFVPANLEQ